MAWLSPILIVVVVLLAISIVNLVRDSIAPPDSGDDFFDLDP